MNSKQLNILLADDDMDDCRFFEQALKELEIPVQLTYVKDGEELMNHISDLSGISNISRMPDVLFLDINMPRKNGLECLKEIKDNKKLDVLPVVMFSTSNSQDRINALFKIGANIYIHKPNDFSQLKQVIRHAISIASDKLVQYNNVKYILNA